jgi:ABC-type uncharacterized transport system ATPase subunit
MNRWYPQDHADTTMQETFPMHVRLQDVTKRFGATAANDAITVSFQSGEIHTLLGENGAGKTTLVRILAGLLNPDAGSISIDGHPVSIDSPKHAIALGIALVSQHPMVAGHLTVLENIIAARAGGQRTIIKMKALRGEVDKIAADCGFKLDLDAKAQSMSLGAQKQLEIVRTLLSGARLIIFDEPTDVLTPAESDAFFVLIRRLADQGKAIVLITHFLREAIAHSQAITILQRGRLVASVVPAETTPAQLAERMVGVLPSIVAATKEAPGRVRKTVLEVDNVSVEEESWQTVRHVSLTVGEGEIVGIAGVAGNGQEDLIEAIVGLRPATEGRIAIDGIRVGFGATRKLIQADSIGYVPPDRHRDGLAGVMSVADNLNFEVLERRGMSRFGLRRFQASARHASRLIERYRIQPPRPDTAAQNLSGGNQQKLILARVLDRNPRLLIVCNPSRGLDVGATAWVWDSVRRVRNENGAVLLLSGDLDEIRSLSDRILVFFRGGVSGELSPDEASSERLGLLMGGAGVKHVA